MFFKNTVYQVNILHTNDTETTLVLCVSGPILVQFLIIQGTTCHLISFKSVAIYSAIYMSTGLIKLTNVAKQCGK